MGRSVRVGVLRKRVLQTPHCDTHQTPRLQRPCVMQVVQNKVGTFCPQENGFNALLKGTDDKPVDGTPPRAGLGWRYMDPGCVGRMCPSDIVWTVYWVDKPIGSVKIKAGLCAERGYHVFSADGKQLFTIKEERPGCCNLMYIPYKIEMGDTDVEVGFARRYIRQFGFRQTRPPFGIKFPDSATKEQKALLALAFVQIDRDLAAREIKSEVDDSPAPSG
jgi:hypothetical protein